MMYDTILSRSFSRSDQKKLGYGAIICCLIIVFSIFTALKPHLGPLPALTLRLKTGDGHKMLLIEEKSAPPEQEVITVQKNFTRMEPFCNVMDPKSDYCSITGDVRVQGSSSTVFVAPSEMLTGNDSWTIRPYARKGDETAMSPIKKWSILPSAVARQPIPICTEHHSVPGVIFSTGGYAGNNFHAFTDIIIPLFLTTRHFGGEVKFLVTDRNPRWVQKFRAILENLSKYEIINIDYAGEYIHCFPRVIVGLKHHKEMTIDPSRSPYSMADFRAFLRSAYSLKKENAIKLQGGELKRRPRLLIVSRKWSRSFTNLAEIMTMAENLGYEVVASELDSNMSRTPEIVNSCDVMMGVHGAGLTNMVFLPENAVLIQVLPIGKFEWHAKVCFGDPAKRMNIEYLDYSIREKESSLMQEFPLDHVVFKDPIAFHKNNWYLFKSMYLDKQNVKLDVNRFRQTLEKALELLR
ncbi:beta-1,2-xylosyltransferase XYXT1-like [Syzygium oleosum]|uniref:beta-1,2-xylosyltransferase XYXT1-like n=1 Tax=Syzygium oleosum TaxID=219896 RepID=UPI0011D1A061|nr:beta-1,2-xylosyltransferase XYXT1-like [Syzygium oleosum]